VDFTSAISRTQSEPTLSREDWLPAESPWPELDELRERHVRLLHERQALAEQRGDLREGFEEEDQRRSDVMKAAYTAGEDPATAELPEATPPEDREAAIAEINEKLKAINQALEDFLNEAIATIQAREGEWLIDLAARGQVASEKREEAARLLAEAAGVEDGLTRTMAWVERTARDRTRMHFPFADMRLPTEEYDKEHWRERLRNAAERAQHKVVTSNV